MSLFNHQDSEHYKIRKLSTETQRNVEIINGSTKTIVDAVNNIKTKTEGARANLESMVYANKSIEWRS